MDLEFRILDIGFEGLRFRVSGVGVQCLCSALGIGLRARTEGSWGNTFSYELKRTCDCQITVPPLAPPESRKWLKRPASCADSAVFPPADFLPFSTLQVISSRPNVFQNETGDFRLRVSCFSGINGMCTRYHPI